MLGWLIGQRNRKARADAAPPSPDAASLAPAITGETASGQSRRDVAEAVVLDVRNRHGSVEHYFHFLFGFLAPILLQPPAELDEPQVIRSCGMLDEHIRALNLPQLTIVSKAEWTALLAGQDRRRVLLGLDSSGSFDRPTLERFRERMLGRLLPDGVPPGDHLLVIDRGRSPAFYQSAESEVKKSAKLRRSIPNLSDIRSAIEHSGRTVLFSELETASLEAQIRLFASARVVIAQHGAALANILWMAPGGTVIEICPKDGVADHFRDVFQKLAQCCGHAHVCIAQSARHAPVEPELVLAALDQAGRTADPATLA